MRPFDGTTNIITIPIGPPGRAGAQGARGQVGPQGRQGIPGLKGEAGRQLIATRGVPQIGDGSNGDIALDLDNFLIYGPKANGAWGQGVPYGVADVRHVWEGTALRLYSADGTLEPGVDLQGPQGAKGNPGTNGTNGTNGAPGTNGTNGTNGGPIPAGGAPGQYATPLAGGGYGWQSPEPVVYDFILHYGG